jgi:hypothetical protein
VHSQNCETWLLASWWTCVCRPCGIAWLPMDRFWWNLILELFFENLLRKFEFWSKPTRITGTVRENVFIFMTISCWILLRMRNVLNKSYGENQDTHLMFIDFFLTVVPFMRQCQKIWWSQRGHRCQYGGIFNAG